ncbi:F-box/LRR-repeat protein 2 [Rhodamnia argentea]|uniref:F-box/LRR-repeat protein 2 n=1 Tax=Rhodamnia argentea TaxID=178133 RepID=A0A8B8QIH9_9MYRT|nr:F-box/LRR-repeat protein 2 [Rhodamnia argentea]
MSDQSECRELPRECWETVFGSLDSEADLEYLSAVCKQFLSISDGLRTSLSIPNQLTPYLPSLLSRFKSLKSIDLSPFRGDPYYVLLQIARFRFPLERLDLSNQQYLRLDGLREMGSKFGALRVLVLSKIMFLQDNDLVSVAGYFPMLEELDISYPELSPSVRVTDRGVSVLSQKLKRLSRIDVSGNQFLSDQSLIALSTNCPSLREIGFRDCSFITQSGIASLIKNRPELVSLAVNDIGLSIMYKALVHSFGFARGLSSLDFSRSFISDGLLMSVAEANIPLKRLVLSRASGFTFDGISEIVLKHRGIEVLDLEAVSFLTDHYIGAICKVLLSLTSVNVSLCSKLTNTTLYNLTRQCPLLKEIKMEKTNLKKDGADETDIVVNSRVRSLNISRNVDLTDEGLKKIVRACPNLQHLNVGYCAEITGGGIMGVLKSCREIKHLEISHCKNTDNLCIDFELPHLEVLHAEGSGLNDQQLAAIGRRCCRLKRLDLPNCLNLSTAGVAEAVSHCRTLRELNLRWCYNLNVDLTFLAWMVFARPSLRRIVPPCPSMLSESQRDFLVQHGCLLCD